EWHTGVGGANVSNDVKGRYYIFDGTAGQFRMIIDTNGHVGFGTSPTANAVLSVQASQGNGFQVLQPNGNSAFYVGADGLVFVRNLSPGIGTSHLCSDNQDGGYLGLCASAAEYVPTVDVGNGYPNTADLVSIAPAVENPYGDTHGPFVVQKSTTA